MSETTIPPLPPDTLLETVYLLKSPANAEHLSKSIEQFRQGHVHEHELLQE